MAKRKPRTLRTEQPTETTKPQTEGKKKVTLTGATTPKPHTETKITFSRPETKKADRKDQLGELNMFQKELVDARDFWDRQYAFADKNRGVDWEAFEKEAQAIANEFNDHGFGVRRDPNRNWADCRKRLHDWRVCLKDAIVEDMAAKVQRMIDAGNVNADDANAFADQINNARGEQAIGVVAGIIRQLEGIGIDDPEEEPRIRGGRQMGGRRRR